MAFFRGGDASFFSQETYQDFIKKESAIHNERLRGENETFFDAMLSEDADFTKVPEGKQILDSLRSYN